MRHFSVPCALVLAAFLLLSVTQAFSQTDNVGIGTTTPERSAILEVSNPYNAITGVPAKGMLVPSMNQLQRNTMLPAYNDTLANGLLIYETDSGFFWYYKYDVPTPSAAPFGNWVKLNTQQPVNNGVPTGGIMMWSGTNASIPAGWNLCDGSNGTPDLTDKFIVSVTSAAENPGTAAEVGFFVDVEAGATLAPDRRFFKLAYIMKL